MVLSYVEHLYKHFKKKLRKSLERFFLKGKKNLFFNRFTPFSPNLDLFKKIGSVTFEPLWIPNFIPNFRKIVGAVLEIRCDGQTGGWTDRRTNGQD